MTNPKGVVSDEWEGLPIVWAPCEFEGYEQAALPLADEEDDEQPE